MLLFLPIKYIIKTRRVWSLAFSRPFYFIYLFWVFIGSFCYPPFFWLAVSKEIVHLNADYTLCTTGKQPSNQSQPTDLLAANESAGNLTRPSSCSSFRILSRSSSSSSSVAGVSSHGSDGPQLVPQGTSGVLGPGLLAAALSGVGSMSNASERLKTELIPASTWVQIE